MLTAALIAQISHPLSNITGIGPLAENVSTGCNSVIKIAALISTSIGFITVLSFIWFIFQFITAALSWVGSSGEKQNLTIAREKMIHATIGLGIAVTAIFIIFLVTSMLGLTSSAGSIFDLQKVINILILPGTTC
jgi:hypothetical protein